MTENEKDYESPIFEEIYIALARLDLSRDDNDVMNWLNENGFPNMTCCPECHVDDFVHSEGCSIGVNL